MKLMTKEIAQRLPRLGETDGVPAGEKICHLKLFTPDGNGTWYICEGQRETGDWLLFGLCDLGEPEFGYVSLAELQSVRGILGLPIERDMYFPVGPMAEVVPAETRMRSVLLRDTVEEPPVIVASMSAAIAQHFSGDAR